MGTYSLDQDGTIKQDNTELKGTAASSAISKSDAQDHQNTIIFRQVSMHSKQVVDKMVKANIPPTPANFAIYFEKLLEEKTQSQKQSINTILELEEVEDFNHVMKIEHNINEGFTQMKSMMDVISNVYTKINKLRTITKARKSELSKGGNSISLASYEEDLDAITSVLTKQQTHLKDQYNKMSTVIKEFNQESVFDKKYDVYNKKYLFKTIDAEKANVKNFGYESSLIALQVKTNSLNDIRLTRDKELIIKTVGKMILKRSRRSDVIAHFQDGVFMLILKHTNLEQAEKTVASIETMIGYSNYIVDSESIDIELDFSLSAIDPTKTKEQIVSKALEGLPS